MPQVRDEGALLDATFSVEDDGSRLALTIESRSGARSSPSARNPDYDPALELLLARLGAMGALIVNAEVYSTAALSDYPDPADRHLDVDGGYPVAVARHDPLELRRELARAQRQVARKPELTSSGNNNRRVRFWLDVPGLAGGDAEALEAQLAGDVPLARLAVMDVEVPAGSGAGARRRRASSGSGQGFTSDPAVRRAVELRAMRLAIEQFEGDGWSVDDTSANRPYDLRCTRDGRELRVEVKGTTGSAGKVHLTAGEVAHASANPDIVALYVVSEIEVSNDGAGKVVASGGRRRLLDPWKVDDGELRPIAYDWTLPES
jgi:hypothetical protein